MTPSPSPSSAVRAAVRVYKQGTSTYVIGTDDTQTALRAAGITPETHRWSSTDFGLFVRRQGRWRAASEYRTPKDAKPGVCFVGPIRAALALAAVDVTETAE